MKKTFEFFGKELPYRRQGLGTEGERTIEVPIAVEFLRKFPLETIVEIGAIMPYHEPRLAELYAVVDPFDPWPGCVKEDGEKILVKKKNILCISTLEHLGHAEYGNTEIDEEKGCRAFDRIIEEAAHYLISVPLGEYPAFDAHIRDSIFKGFTYERVNKENDWRFHHDLLWNFAYNDPFPYGNGVIFITNVRFPS